MSTPRSEPRTIRGTTRVAGIIGHPIRHSLSPALHNAAYAALGLDWIYAAFEVPDGATRGALDAARALGLVGLSVTMPHKTAAAAACDDLTPDAKALQSVNTVTPLPDGRLHGDSTDGEGLLRALREAGHDPAGARVLLLGAGGAARALALALGRAGAHLTVSARRTEAAEAAAALALGASTCPWGERDGAAVEADVIVHATPIGMAGDETAPLGRGALQPGQVVADLVYHPLDTPLLVAARERGAIAIDGLAMLVHQAALQIERWSGRQAPVEAMRRAAAAALERP